MITKPLIIRIANFGVPLHAARRCIYTKQRHRKEPNELSIRQPASVSLLATADTLRNHQLFGPEESRRGSDFSLTSIISERDRERRDCVGARSNPLVDVPAVAGDKLRGIERVYTLRGIGWEQHAHVCRLLCDGRLSGDGSSPNGYRVRWSECVLFVFICFYAFRMRIFLDFL